MTIKQEFQRDPGGAALVALIPILLVLIAAYFYAPQTPNTTPDRVPKGQFFGDAPPPGWRDRAKSSDILQVPGYTVQYWGKPSARYSRHPRHKFKAIVTHYTLDRPPLNLVKYGHNYDRRRGGSFGYHFYIAKDGSIFQGAPLSRRTNHIKRPGHKQRRKTSPKYMSNSNSVGITAVGACVRVDVKRKWRCAREQLTGAQIRAGKAVVKALQRKLKLPCTAIYGHGEMQRDRATFEGSTLAEIVRSGCEAPSS